MRELVAVAPAHQAEVLGQRDQLRAGGGGLRDQPRGGLQVARHVGRGHHLHCGDLHLDLLRTRCGVTARSIGTASPVRGHVRRCAAELPRVSQLLGRRTQPRRRPATVQRARSSPGDIGANFSGCVAAPPEPAHSRMAVDRPRQARSRPALAEHSRFVQRVRRRYAAELPLLPPGVPDAATASPRWSQRCRPTAATLPVGAARGAPAGASNGWPCWTSNKAPRWTTSPPA